MLSSYYKKESFTGLLQQPMDVIHYLYYTAVEESRTDEGKEKKKAEAVQEALGG